MKEKLFITLHSPNTHLLPNEQTLRQINENYASRVTMLAQRIISSAKDKTPVRTGKLKRGYRLSQSSDISSVNVGIDNEMYYFTYVENPLRYPKRRKGIQKVGTATLANRSQTRPGRMLGKALEEYRKPLQVLENDYISDIEASIGIGE